MGSDADDESLTPEGKKRVKQLRYVWNEERRNKEKAEREANAAVDYARQILDENRRLKEQLSTGERVLIDQAKSRASAEVEGAKAAYRMAHESGDPDSMIKAQEALARAVHDHQKYSSYVPQSPPPGQQQQQPYQQNVPQQQPPSQPPAAPMDDRTREWISKNPWFGTPGYEEITSFAAGVHTKLLNRGVFAKGETADEYWDHLNQRLHAVFPEHFGHSSAKTNGTPNPNQNVSSQQVRNNAPRPVVATAGARPSTSLPTKVRLTQSQAQIARKLGLTTEQYARQLVKEGLVST